MCRAGLELTTSWSRGRCFSHCAMVDIHLSETIFPIYGQPVFMMNFSTDKHCQGNRNSLLVSFQCKHTIGVKALFCEKSRNYQKDLALFQACRCLIKYLQTFRATLMRYCNFVLSSLLQKRRLIWKF